jgi:regulation of enolase protein 1 (concanavalin A-like superfamily)
MNHQSDPTAPVLYHNISGDFDAAVTVVAEPNKPYQLAGIGIRSATDHRKFVRIGIQSNGGDLRLVAIGTGKQLDGHYTAEPNYDASSIQLRIKRRAGKLAFSYRANESIQWKSMPTPDSSVKPDGGIDNEAELFLNVISTNSGEGLNAKFLDFSIRPTS